MFKGQHDAGSVYALMKRAAQSLQMDCRHRMRADATLAEAGLDAPRLISLLMVLEPELGWLPADTLDGIGPHTSLLSVAQRVAEVVQALNDPHFGGRPRCEEDGPGHHVSG